MSQFLGNEANLIASFTDIKNIFRSENKQFCPNFFSALWVQVNWCMADVNILWSQTITVARTYSNGDAPALTGSPSNIG